MGAREKTRASLIVIVAGALSLAACSSPPTPGPSGTVSTTPTASASSAPTNPGPSPTVTDPDFQRRDPGMSDGEALARMSTPITGERWFARPRLMATPGWAQGDPYLDADWVAWYEMGTRGDRTIVGFMEENITEIFERSPTGEWEWLPYPSGREAITGAAASTFGYDEVPANVGLYYDTLSLPSQFTLPTGEPLLVPAHDRGGLAIPGFEPDAEPDGTVIDTIGGYRVVRYSTPVIFVWAAIYEGVNEPLGLEYDDVFYMLETPYGTTIPLTYGPVGSLGDITWTIDTLLTPNSPLAYLADLNDIGCGVWERDHNTAVLGSLDSDWTRAGTTALGELVYIMNEENPLAEPLYLTYRAFREDQGLPVVSLEDFMAGPGVVGYRSRDTGYWFAYLNGIYSARAWC